MNNRLILGFVIIAVAALVLMIFLVSKTSLTIEQVKERYESELMAIDGVVGVGIGECEGKPCIKVYLENDSPDLKKRIPLQLDGFKVETEVTGPIEALPK